jgi:p-hydroxybenzoate 3-monooxygenase
LRFEAEVVDLENLDSALPVIRYRSAGREHRLACTFIAGCDGFHGIARAALPAAALTVYERIYPFAWLGILAATPPASDELIYASHADGFALLSMRTPQISRLYIQVEPEARLADWPDARIWDALRDRLAAPDLDLEPGPILQKGITPMRSFVAAPLRHGPLLLAGDAAHIVPPTGAKGMNLAVHDIRVLAPALIAALRHSDAGPLAAYSETALRRVWRAQHFSWWLTSLLHRFPDADAFTRQLQRAQLDQLITSRAAATVLAEGYVGIFEDTEPAMT